MYTVCPHCKTVHPLQSGRKKRKSTLTCASCNKKFKITEVLEQHPLGLVAETKAEVIIKPGDAVPKYDTKTNIIQEVDSSQFSAAIGIRHHDVSDDPEMAQVDKQAEDRLPWELEPMDQRPVKHWAYGFAAGLLLFMVQLLFFCWDDWSQDKRYRPYLEIACRQLGCRVPEYRNLGEFEVNQGSLVPGEGGTLSFRAVISNHSMYPQPFPKIKLKLSDYNGQVIAERTFNPEEYRLPKGKADATVPAEETFAVHLQLAKPPMPVGGFTFDLVE